MKQQKKLKKLNKIRFLNLPKKSNEFWIKFKPSFFKKFPGWFDEPFKQRYRSEKALLEGLKSFKRKGHEIIAISLDKEEL